MLITLDEAGRIVELSHPLNILSPKVVGPLGSAGQALVISADGQHLEWGAVAGAGTVTGTGVNKQISYWTGTTSQAGDTGLVYEYNGGTPTEGVMVVGAATSESGLNVKLQLINDSVTIQGVGILGYRGSPAYLLLASSLGNRGASEAAITTGTNLGQIVFLGRESASAWQSVTARIAAIAEEDFSATLGGTKLVFSATPIGGTSLQAHFTILNDGSALLRTGFNLGQTVTGAGAGELRQSAATQVWNSLTLTAAATGTLPVGTGTSGRVAYWSGTNTLTSDADLTFNGTTLTLGTGGNTFPTARNIDIDDDASPSIGFSALNGNPFSIGINLASRLGFIIYNDNSDNIPLFIDTSDNIGLNSVASFGTSATGVLAMRNGTAPSAAVADQFHLYAKDAAAGKSWPTFKAEDNTERFVLGVSGTGNSVTNVRTLTGSTLTAQTGYLTLHDNTGAAVYVPYFSAV